MPVVPIQSSLDCRFFPNCHNMNCPFNHPKVNELEGWGGGGGGGGRGGGGEGRGWAQQFLQSCLHVHSARAQINLPDQSSHGALWVAKGPKHLQAGSKDSDQPA